METGVPTSLMTPYGEIVFNVLDGDASGIAPYVGQDIIPGSLPDGNGYLLQFISGGEGADVRNPTENKPHAHGVIPHRYRKTARIHRMEGLVVATTPEYRRILDDHLIAALDSILQRENNSEPVDRRLYWNPPGRSTRFLNVSLYEFEGIDGEANAAPKTFKFALVSSRTEALSLELTETVIPEGVTTVLPNNGNARTWPTLKITPSLIEVLFRTYDVTIQCDEGFSLRFSGVVPEDRTYIEVNTLNSTAYWDGSHENALGSLDMEASDFWPIPVQGTSALITGGSATVLSNDAWVGG